MTSHYINIYYVNEYNHNGTNNSDESKFLYGVQSITYDILINVDLR